MRSFLFAFLLTSLCIHPSFMLAGEDDVRVGKADSWPQWRGPTRDGLWDGPAWPNRLAADSLRLLWRVPLDPSYSGPIVTRDMVFTTETKNKDTEVVYALDRKTGKERWRTEWKGSITVPFFAASNGRLDPLDPRL